MNQVQADCKSLKQIMPQLQKSLNKITPAQSSTAEKTLQTLEEQAVTTSTSQSICTKKVKYKLLQHKEQQYKQTAEIKNFLNPTECIINGIEKLWKIIFPKLHIFYSKIEDIPDTLEINQEQQIALKTIKSALTKKVNKQTQIQFLTEQLQPSFQSKEAQEHIKLKFAVLRENTTYYGQKTEDKIHKSFIMTAKYLYEYSLYAMQKAVDEYVSPKTKGKWNANNQSYDAPQYPFPPLGELRSKLQHHHNRGIKFLQNCEFLLNL